MNNQLLKNTSTTQAHDQAQSCRYAAFHYPSHYGTALDLWKCDGSVIGNNTITYGTAPTTGTGGAGISLSHVSNAMVTQNDIGEFPRGIYLEDDCIGTQLTCNILDGNYYGVYIDDAEMSDQGSLSEGSDNQWTGTVSGSDIAGNADMPIDWWYYDQGALSYQPNVFATNVTRRSTPNDRNCSAGIPSFFTAPIAEAAGAKENTQGRNNQLSMDSHSIASPGIFPNPASDRITVQVPDRLLGHSTIIYNSNGQQVEQVKLDDSEVTITIDHLADGLYFLTTHGNQWKFVKK